MLQVFLKDRWLVVSFDELQETRSWAIYGGSRKVTQKVVWYQVQKGDLNISIDAKEFSKRLFIQNGFENAVGLLTGASLSRYADVQKTDGDLSVRSIGTVGMENVLRVGDPIGQFEPVGTINLLCAISVPLTEEAFLEAISLVVEARTAAVLTFDISSSQTGFSATGTGTDCIVVAAPTVSKVPPLEFVGKHTPVGSLIGSSISETMSQALHSCSNIRR